MAKKPKTSWIIQALKILGTMVGSGLFLTGLNYFLQDKTPHVIVRQFYNSVEPQKAVPTQVGSLLINYQPTAPQPTSEYVIQVMNTGRGPEDDVRLDIRFVNWLPVKEPDGSDLKIYQPENMSWNNGTYFVNLKQFPKDAFAQLIFEVTGDPSKLCETKVRVAGKQKEATVEKVKGLTCKP
ncbi:hypothetical protein K1X76_10875 [bacterium]|nr:hypothetical protein [bacterium]